MSCRRSGEVADLAVERGREEQRLALAGRARPTIRSTAGRKPMSSMRSASSRTSIADVLQRHGAARRIRSSRRPGVATSDVGLAGGLAALAARCRAAVDRGDAQRAGVAHRVELVDDLAGELAGRGRARAPAGRGPSASRRSTIGTPKASVLPEPVGDLVSTSRPASTSATTSCWTAKGSSMPRADRASVDRAGHAEIGEGLRRHVRTPCCDGKRGPSQNDPGDSTDPDRTSARDKNPASDGVARTPHASRVFGAGRATPRRRACSEGQARRLGGDGK